MLNEFFYGGAAAGPGPGPGHVIERSLRFNTDDSSYLKRTPSTAGNRKTFTFSAWVKLAGIGTGFYTLFQAGADDFRFSFNELGLNKSGVTSTSTTAVYRDPSAWYHVVLAVDNTLSSDRTKIYVNNSLAAHGNTYSQNEDTPFGNTQDHYIGKHATASGREFDGYLADVHFIDGQALAPTDFGTPDSNGVWQPKAYAGSYGTNGFHLDFSDNSSSAALGADSSGNGNDWTVNNLVADGGVAYSNNVGEYVNSLQISYPVTNLFDGDTATGVRSSTTSGSGIKFVPPTAITGSIELFLRNGDTENSTFSYSLDNGSSFTSLTTTGGSGSYVSIGSQTITNADGIIIRHVTTAGSNFVDWRAIRADSITLTDGNPSNTDSLIDTPTNYIASSGNNGGNYAAWSPLVRQTRWRHNILKWKS